MSASDGAWSSSPAGKMVPQSFMITATGRAPGGYTVYKVSFEVKVDLPHGETVFNTFEIWKRFTDFQQLSKQLEIVHAQARVPDKFPRLIKASYFERFKDAVIEERKMSAVEILKFASTQNHLIQSLSRFTEGAVKVKSMPFQQTPVQPTTTYIEKPKDKVPLSKLLQDTPYTAEDQEEPTPHTPPGSPHRDSGGQTQLTPPTDSGGQTQFTPPTDSGGQAQFTPPTDLGRQAQFAPHSADSDRLSIPSREQSCSPSNSKAASPARTNPFDPTDPADSVTEKTFNEFYIASPASTDDEESRDDTISSVARDGPLGEGGGLSWWSDAMAVTDDLDTLVERVNENSVSTLDVAMETANESRKSQSRSPSPGRRQVSPGRAKAPQGADYIGQAGKLITAALKCERQREYQEAFDLFKAGVDLLLNGVQTDSSKSRREKVSKKTAEYLHHAEALHKKYLSSEGPPTEVNPPMTAVKPHHLPDFKVVAIMDKVLVVQSRHTGHKFAVKALYKSLQLMSSSGRGRTSTNRAPAQCPHMVKLLHHFETPNHRIFLLLEYVERGRLVDFVTGKRVQWRRLHEAALNPPSTSSLVKRSHDPPPPTVGVADDKDMERMLCELTHIVPPTSLPTDSLTSDQSDGGVEEEEEGDGGEDSLSRLRRRLQEMVSVCEESEESGGVSVSVQPPTPTAATGPVAATRSTSKLHSGTSSPQYSPGSRRGSSGPSTEVDDWGKRLEDNAHEWAAQITLALEHLHTHGIICRDLNPANVLLSDSGKAVLTYFGKWDYVEQRSKFELIGQLYMAPELRGLGEVSEACDWWSLGALLFEILTGKSLVSCHPGGLHSHLSLHIPTPVSPEAQSFLSQLLQVDPRERLGSGQAGAEELKSHPFFSGIDWKTV